MQNRLANVLESFLYEVSAYLIPGILLSLFIYKYSIFIIYSEVELTYKYISHLSLSSLGGVEWLFLLITAYILGMVNAGLVSFILGLEPKLVYRFHTSFSIYKLLRNEKPSKVLVDIRVKVRKQIEDFFELGSLAEDENIRQSSRIIGQLLEIYFEERSNHSAPSGRYNSRLCLCRNLALVIFLFSIFQIWIVSGEAMLSRLLVSLFGILMVIALMWFVTKQGFWLAKLQLRRFYVMQLLPMEKLEKADSEINLR